MHIMFIYMQMENMNVWKIMDEYSLDKATCFLFISTTPQISQEHLYFSF